MKRTIWNDGDRVEPEHLTAISAAADLALQQDVARPQFGAGELQENTTFGFLGQSFRVKRKTSTAVTVVAGIGHQLAGSGYPAGESALRAVRLAADKDLTVLAASTGNWRRDLVCVKWHDKTTTAARTVMAEDGTISTPTETLYREPEVDDGVDSTLQLVGGTPAGSAGAAARPSVPADYVALAEVLVSDAGIAAAANLDGNTAGIVDLRPRLVFQKAAGAVEARRASSSAGSTQAATRWGAKAVGMVYRAGVVQVPASGSPAVVTLDDSIDWRDLLVTLEVAALQAAAALPGSASDASAQWATVPWFGLTNDPGLARVKFYTGTGLVVAGPTGYWTFGVRTAADHASTTLRYFADSATGALSLYGEAGDTSRYLCWEAWAFGPLGKRPASGVEA